MITRHEGHGSFAKQFLKEGSMGATMKVSHLQSQHPYSSGENLSPRSVLQQRALSGLAIAIDLEEKMKLSHTQESVILCRFFSKQSMMHMSIQEAKASMGRSLSRERLNHMICMNHDERETLSDESNVGLKMVISMQQMSNQEGKAQETLIMGRSIPRERMRQMNDEERAVSGSSNVGLGGERKQDNEVSSSGDLPPNFVKSLHPSTRRSSCERRQSTCWLHELGHVQQSFPACTSSMEDSIFYYAANPPSTTSYRLVDDDGYQACSPVEDFLKCCFFCKRRLGAGKDIFMYRGDQAFCSVECRYEQIVKDECMGTSAL